LLCEERFCKVRGGAVVRQRPSNPELSKQAKTEQYGCAWCIASVFNGTAKQKYLYIVPLLVFVISHTRLKLFKTHRMCLKTERAR